MKKIKKDASGTEGSSKMMLGAEERTGEDRCVKCDKALEAH